jgi:NitT/TauT family transport system substrate-binding protein
VPTTQSPFRRLAALALLGSLALAACGGGDRAGAGPTAEPAPVTLHLGYFPNITHAPALVGVEKGFLAGALAPNVTLKTATFNAGPAAIEALFADALDIAYIGPNPAINGYAKSDGQALRIIAGATSGGAFLVVRPGITSASELKGKKIATPQLGNTQDVALRAWLQDQGLETTTTGTGDVSIVPQENAQTLETFRAGDIDGAWVPEPWATRLVVDGGGHVLVDERDLWPGGQYVTTHVIVRTKFLEQHPDVVRQFLAGHLAAIDWIETNPEEAKTVVNAGIDAITHKPLAPEILDGAWSHLTFTADPIASSLQTSADHATAVGLLDPVDLAGIYDLDLLNQILSEQGRPSVEGLT